MKELNSDAFIARHSIKPKGEDMESEDYPGISEKGVELSSESAKELEEIIEKTEPGSIIFIGGASNLIRTKSTGEARGEALKNNLADRPDIKVFAKSDIDEAKKNGGKTSVEILDYIRNNPDKKVVVNTPMVLKELSIDEWFQEDGKTLIPYFAELLKKNDYDEPKALKEWFENKGELGELKGPKPLEVAQKYLKAVDRLKEFAKKQVGDRPVTIGMVGHSFEIDALVTYLGNEGDISVEGFENVSGGTMIKETEMTQIKVTDEGAFIEYRGKEYKIAEKNK